MDSQQGWIKLHRKIYSNPWSRDPEWLAVWCYLLTHVAWEPTDVIFEGKRITIQAGQMTTGRKIISQETGVSESKVRRVLDCLENDQQISQQTTPRCRLITVNNWERYQQNDQQISQQTTNKRPTTDQQTTTNKEYKEYKETKKERNIGETSSPTPSQTMKDFCEMIQNKTDRYYLFIQNVAQTKKFPPEIVRAEVDKFVNYWLEKTRDGKKERWQTEKTFEVQRRLATWFLNAQKYHANRAPASGTPTIIR